MEHKYNLHGKTQKHDLKDILDNYNVQWTALKSGLK